MISNLSYKGLHFGCYEPVPMEASLSCQAKQNYCIVPCLTNIDFQGQGRIVIVAQSSSINLSNRLTLTSPLP